MSEELKPCLCGNNVSIHSYYGNVWYKVKCKCGIRNKAYKSRQDAINAWNNRPIEDSLRQQVSELIRQKMHLEVKVARLEKETDAALRQHIDDLIRRNIDLEAKVDRLEKSLSEKDMDR